MKTKKSASDVGNAETNFYQHKYIKSFKNINHLFNFKKTNLHAPCFNDRKIGSLKTYSSFPLMNDNKCNLQSPPMQKTYVEEKIGS